MEKKPTKKAVVAKKTAATNEIRLKAEPAVAATSTVKKRATKTVNVKATAKVETPRAAAPKKAVKKIAADVTAEIAASEPKAKLSPAFRALAEPVLPELSRENRARLLMQTPTRLYFYWAVKENPWTMLKKAFGSDTGSYTLVLKLTNLRRDSEEIHPCDAAGNWWFDVEPDSEYQAEIGFYAPNRPYFRVIYSKDAKFVVSLRRRWGHYLSHYLEQSILGVLQ